MEEILASIRKIISEDQPADGPRSAARLAPFRPQVAPQPAPPRAPAPADPAPELDVLDLTDEVHEDPVPASVAPVAPVSSPAAAIEDAEFQTIDALEVPQRGKDDELISDTTRHAMGRAFANVERPTPPMSLKGGSIEAVFAEAVQQAFRPALREWIDDHSGEMMDQLRPLIRAWMDEHLPPLIEAAVVKEIARAAQKTQKP